MEVVAKLLWYYIFLLIMTVTRILYSRAIIKIIHPNKMSPANHIIMTNIMTSTTFINSSNIKNMMRV